MLVCCGESISKGFLRCEELYGLLKDSEESVLSLLPSCCCCACIGSTDSDF
jgi:hypothetical protein